MVNFFKTNLAVRYFVIFLNKKSLKWCHTAAVSLIRNTILLTYKKKFCVISNKEVVVFFEMKVLNFFLPLAVCSRSIPGRYKRRSSRHLRTTVFVIRVYCRQT